MVNGALRPIDQQQQTQMQSQGMLKTHSLRNICGPFDREFNRKFIGRRSTSLYSQRKNLLKLPAPLPITTTSIDLLPKIKEIEKISKSSGRKLPRASKYGEVLSDLQLYLAKKMISNQSTKQLIFKIEENTHRGEGKWLQEGSRMPKYSQTQSNFYTPPALESQIITPNPIFPNQTTYSPSKKWISDDEFRSKFDRFIVKPVEPEVMKLNDLLGTQRKVDSQRIIGKIGTDKQALRQIVKKMIEENNIDSQGEDIQRTASHLSKKSEKSLKEQRGIRWILQNCQDFQQKFKPRKANPWGKL